MDDPRGAPLRPEKPILWPPILKYGEYKKLPKEKPKPIVDGLLDAGSRILFGGGSKTFKTWLQCDLALSIASGTDWLGFRTHQVPVLYVNFEIRDYYMHQRLTAIEEAKGIKRSDDTFFIWNMRQFLFDRDKLVSELLKLCEIYGVVIVFLDPFYRLLRDDEEENSQGDMRKVLRSFDLINTADISSSLGMHYSKGNQAAKEPEDRISGAGTLVRDSDALLTLTKHKTEHAFTLDFILRDHPPIDSFVIAWNVPLMERTDLDPKDLRKAGRPAESSTGDLLSFIKEHDDELEVGEMVQKAIEELGWSESSVYRRYRELKAAKSVFISKVTRCVNAARK